MGFGISFTVEDAGLKQKLRAMTPQEEGRIFTRAMTQVLGPLQRAVKANTPVGPTGNLKKSIAKVARKYGDGKLVLGFVGPNWWNQGRHGHLVEHGTVRRFTRTGKSTGLAQPKPFLGPVYNANRQILEDGLKSSVTNQLNAWWSK